MADREEDTLHRNQILLQSVTGIRLIRMQNSRNCLDWKGLKYIEYYKFIKSDQIWERLTNISIKPGK